MTMRYGVIMGLLVLSLAAAAQDSPPRPSGLEGEDEEASGSQGGPALPEGLNGGGADDADGGGPALPPGLGGDAGEEDGPGLPPGLGGEKEDEDAPDLPAGLGEEPAAGDGSVEEEEGHWTDKLPFTPQGFWEVRGGLWFHDNDPQPPAASAGETRFQLDIDKQLGPVFFESMTDVIGDGVLERVDLDVRQLRVSFTPVSSVDVQLGRQVLTWGTGDLIFINDLFPKDWQSYFLGRDVEYLKAPEDAVRMGWYPDLVNVEFVYAPQFTSDRHIDGERISYYDPLLNRMKGHDSQLDTNPPSDWFTDDEFHVRLYRTFGRYEAALYGYSGYWKSPGGQKLLTMQATFPRLHAYGASLRGPVGPGIGNIEAGYYDSADDPDGANPFINNDEFRLLLGYEQELAKDFTGAVQVYLEHMMDYEAYRRSNFSRLIEPRDKDRWVITTRLTKLAMSQTLTLSFFGYFSPTDNDAYLRPKVNYKITDAWMVEGGFNIFLGEHPHTFFGQFEDNTNVYAGLRWSF